MQLTITGKTNDKGDLLYWNIGQLTDFLVKNSSRDLIITFETQDEDSRKRMLRYYNVKIIKEWKQSLLNKGEVLSESEVDNRLRMMSPITENKSLSELSRDELVLYLDHVKLVSAEEVNLFIEDPRFI